MTALELLRRRKREILAIASRYGASAVRVFGSVARGEANDASDVDLLVRLEPGRTLLDHVGMWQDLEELLGGRVDLLVEGGLSPYLEERILDEAVPL
jgi:predicted nucleotidyltransferase